MAVVKSLVRRLYNTLPSSLKKSYSLRFQKYFSQHGEDKYIENVLKGRKIALKKRIIDIGALTGLHNSNSRRFLSLGWDGILIEPNPKSFAELKSNVSKFKKVKLYLENVAISDKNEKLEFFAFDEEPGHSRIPNHNHKVSSKYMGMKPRTIAVDSITLEELFTMYPEFTELGILDIDVEGLEEMILAELMKTEVRPQIIIVEHQKDTNRMHDQRTLLSEEYILLNTIEVNDIWLHRNIEADQV